MNGMWWILQRKENLEKKTALIREREAKNAELERFIYAASHDLRSPLVTIQGFVDFWSRTLRVATPGG